MSHKCSYCRRRNPCACFRNPVVEVDIPQRELPREYLLRFIHPLFEPDPEGEYFDENGQLIDQGDFEVSLDVTDYFDPGDPSVGLGEDCGISEVAFAEDEDIELYYDDLSETTKQRILWAVEKHYEDQW